MFSAVDAPIPAIGHHVIFLSLRQATRQTFARLCPLRAPERAMSGKAERRHRRLFRRHVYVRCAPGDESVGLQFAEA
jgi:hypothetical protein